MTAGAQQRIGVAIVAFNAGDFIAECLESLFASEHATLDVVVVDNNSTDATCARIRSWASGAEPFVRPADSPLKPCAPVAKPVAFREGEAQPAGDGSTLTLLQAPVNGGYAYGCNLAIAHLMRDPAIDLVWIVNPDCVAAPQTARELLDAGADGQFAMLGGRPLGYERPDLIQTDGGRVSRRTGVCSSVHAGMPAASTPLPDPAGLDYITGAHLCVSRRFVEARGMMTEGYFLYYEEVDWAFRRGALPLRLTGDAVVYHRGGATIGSGSHGRRASAFSNYFNYRNRRRFVLRHLPGAQPLCLAHALAKAAQLAIKGAFDETSAILRGVFGLAPPHAVAARIVDPAARRLAFGKD
jgi:GT2 family glycosyltransferase